MFEIAFKWLGGTIFVAALALCAYSYAVVWSRPSPFDAAAIPTNVALFAAFAAHHSLLARDSVKARLARVIPDRLMRSVYVWIASALLVNTCLLWRPVGGDVYRLAAPLSFAGTAVQIAGLGVIAWSVRAIDSLELAGIRQSALSSLQVNGPYRVVRHPLYLGWLLATFGTMHLTGDRLTFATIAAIYLAAAVPWEERALRTKFGAAYVDYERHVRWRVVPFVY